MVFLPGTVQAEDTVQWHQSTMNDTEFVGWLMNWSPERRDQKIARFKKLTAHGQVGADTKLRFFQEWTTMRGNLAKPRRQISLALQLKQEQLADRWIDRWLKAGRHASKKYIRMLDLVVDHGQYKSARKIVKKARRFYGSYLMFQRKAALEQATGHYRQALKEYLNALGRFRMTRSMEARINNIIRSGNLTDYFLDRVARRVRKGKIRDEVTDFTVKFLVEQRKINRLIQFLKNITKGKKHFRKNLRRVQDRLLKDNNYKMAQAVSGEILNSRPNNTDRIEAARIEALLGDTGSARVHLNKVDTSTLTDTHRMLRQRVNLRIALLGRDQETARDMLKTFDTGEVKELRIAYYRTFNQYEKLDQYLEKQSISNPWLTFYSDYMRGIKSDTVLERLVRDHPDDPNTPVALAIMGVKQESTVRKFFRWLDRFTVFHRIPEPIPAGVRKHHTVLPKVLLKQWMSRFNAQKFEADTLRKWGHQLNYPPLLMKAARAYRDSDRPGEAIQILEDMIIKYPRSMLRYRAEELLEEIS
ncbi:MAG: hypothetical protein ABEJ65_04800 [bacterium]